MSQLNYHCSSLNEGLLYYQLIPVDAVTDNVPTEFGAHGWAEVQPSV